METYILLRGTYLLRQICGRGGSRKFGRRPGTQSSLAQGPWMLRGQSPLLLTNEHRNIRYTTRRTVFTVSDDACTTLHCTTAACDEKSGRAQMDRTGPGFCQGILNPDCPLPHCLCLCLLRWMRHGVDAYLFQIVTDLDKNKIMDQAGLHSKLPSQSPKPVIISWDLHTPYING